MIGYINLYVLECSVMSDPSRAFRMKLVRLLCPWDSPGKNSGVGSLLLCPRDSLGKNSGMGSLLQEIFPT